jgi:hypothetical protein
MCVRKIKSHVRGKTVDARLYRTELVHGPHKLKNGSGKTIHPETIYCDFVVFACALNVSATKN